jgi:hypothetical protein
VGDARSKAAITMASRKKTFRKKERITSSFLQAAGAVAVPRLHPSQSPPGFRSRPLLFFPPCARQIPSNIPATLHCTAPRAEVKSKREPRRPGEEARGESGRVCRARAYGNGVIVRRRRGWITGTGRALARAPSAAPAASASASGRRSSRRRRCCSCRSVSSSSATPPSGTCLFSVPSGLVFQPQRAQR